MGLTFLLLLLLLQILTQKLLKSSLKAPSMLFESLTLTTSTQYPNPDMQTEIWFGRVPTPPTYAL